MKKKKLSFKKIDFKRFKLKKGGRFGLAGNRERDWKIILLVMLSLVILLSIFSFYIFSKVNTGTLFNNTKERDFKIDTLNKGDLKKTVEEIESTKTNFRDVILKTPQTYDPSQ